MKLEELKELARRGESETLEFKKTTGQLTAGMKTLCAFLNGDGGRVVFGVTPGGEVVGQDVGKDTIRAVKDALKKFEPGPKVELERVKVGKTGREAIVLTAAPGRKNRPYVYDGKAYEKTDATKSVMPRERYIEVLMENSPDHRWERMPSGRYGLEDLDEEEIFRTIRLGIENGRLPERTGLDAKDFLKRSELIIGEVPINAAVVLFAKEIGMD